MDETWFDLADSARWRSTVGFIRNWVGPFDVDHGMSAVELGDVLRSVPFVVPMAVREWCMLAANWQQEAINAWVRPHALSVQGGVVSVLSDAEGINSWGIRVADLNIDDPPVVSVDADRDEIDFPKFTSLVAAMIVNDVIFAPATEEPIKLDPGSVREHLTCFVSSRNGDYFANTTLDSATLIAFAYPGGGPVFGRAKDPVGVLLLDRLRL